MLHCSVRLFTLWNSVWKRLQIGVLFLKAQPKRAFIILGSAIGMGGILGCIFLWATLPNIDDPRTLLAAQSTVILDRNGIELYRLFSGLDRT